MTSQYNVPITTSKTPKLPTKTTKVGDTTFVSVTPYYETKEGKAARKEQKKNMKSDDMYSTPDAPSKITKKSKKKTSTTKKKKKK